jgi:hypothetical protein
MPGDIRQTRSGFISGSRAPMMWQRGSERSCDRLSGPKSAPRTATTVLCENLLCKLLMYTRKARSSWTADSSRMMLRCPANYIAGSRYKLHSQGRSAGRYAPMGAKRSTYPCLTSRKGLQQHSSGDPHRPQAVDRWIIAFATIHDAITPTWNHASLAN